MKYPTVSIIGAGTAGLTTAYLLSQHADVTVYEVSREIGHRYQNSVQAIRNYDVAGDVLEMMRSYGFNLPNHLTYPIYRQVRFFPDGSYIVIEDPNKPAFYALMRGQHSCAVDQYLYQRSATHCTYKLGTRVKDVDSLESDFVISARGSGKLKGAFKIAGLEFQGTSSYFPPNTLILVLNQEITPGGYIAIIPFLLKNLFQIAIVCGWDASVKVRINPQTLLDYLLSHPTLSRQFLQDFNCQHYVIGYGNCGFINPPTSRQIFIGEEFGGLDCGLAYGNLNAFMTSVAATQVVKTGNVNAFMYQLNEMGILSSIEAGVIRRLAMQRITNERLNHESQRIRETIGQEITYQQYITYKQKSSGLIKKLIGQVMAKVILKYYTGRASR